MVQQAYPPIHRHKSFEFGEARADGGRIAQRVHIVDDNGEAWEAMYTLEQQSRRQLEDHRVFAVEGGSGGVAPHEARQYLSLTSSWPDNEGGWRGLHHRRPVA